MTQNTAFLNTFIFTDTLPVLGVQNQMTGRGKGARDVSGLVH
jgi:hypothetical protein